MSTTVVHCKRDDFTVYIGRGKDPKTGKESIWGNPFSYKEQSAAKFKVANLEESILYHKRWFIQQLESVERLPELKGEKLGCWCKPAPCHGDFLAVLADAYDSDQPNLLYDVLIDQGLRLVPIIYWKITDLQIYACYPDRRFRFKQIIADEAQRIALVDKMRWHVINGGQLNLNHWRND